MPEKLCFICTVIFLLIFMGIMMFNPWYFIRNKVVMMWPHSSPLWLITLATQVTPEAPAHPCLLHHYSQYPSYGYKRNTYFTHILCVLCPTIDEWIKKMWYLYTMEFYLAMKENEIL
jgi:hypothetical protein